jgi:hypothetical protein
MTCGSDARYFSRISGKSSNVTANDDRSTEVCARHESDFLQDVENNILIPVPKLVPASRASTAPSKRGKLKTSGQVSKIKGLD